MNYRNINDWKWFHRWKWHMFLFIAACTNIALGLLGVGVAGLP